MGPVAAETTLASTPSATHDPKHDAAALQAVGGLWGCIANPGGTPSPTFYRASRNAIATTVIDSMTNESRRGGDLSRICFRPAPRCLRRCAWPHPACRQRRLAINQTLAQDHDRRSRGVGIMGA